MDDGRAGLHRLFGIEDRGQKFIINLDEVKARLGRRFALGDHRSDPLTDVADDAIENQRIVRIVGIHLVPGGREMARGRVKVGQDRGYAGERARRRRVDAQNSRRSMRRAQDFHVQEPGQLTFRRDIHGVADPAGDDPGPCRRGQTPAGLLARLSMLDVLQAGDRVGDGAVARATAEVALERRRQVPPLALIEGGCGHDHPRSAEAALEALGVEERALRRVKPVRRREALDRRDLDALSPIGRNEAAMDRPSVEMHGAGAAVAGVAALLHAEESKLAEKCAQALSGPRRGFEDLAVDEKIHGRPPASSWRVSSANSNVMCRRQSGSPCTSSW